MYSKMHQMLVGLIGRRMRENGYDIVAFDGRDYLFDGQEIHVPPTIRRHRPDIVGFKFETKEVCVGEAKTHKDLFSKRTREQLLDYSATTAISTGKHIEIVLGIPESAREHLARLLQTLNLSGKDFISSVWLPEELVDNG